MTARLTAEALHISNIQRNAIISERSKNCQQVKKPFTVLKRLNNVLKKKPALHFLPNTSTLLLFVDDERV
jgi:hypothetical protein